MMTALVLPIVAYLSGTITTAILVSRLFRLPDPRTVGSGNVGATNIARSGNKPAAALTLLIDGGKGVPPMWIADLLQQPPEVVVACGVAAVLGHIFNPFLKFSGGRGVATSLGVFLYLHPLIGVIALATWLAVFACLRLSSLASLTAVLSAAILFFIHTPPTTSAGAALIAVLVLLRHYDNIKRLLQGKELKVKKHP